MASRPLLSDVEAARLRPDAGQRLLVRVSSELTPEQRQRVERGVKKFVRNDVRVLIVNCLQVRIVWRQPERGDVVLVEPTDSKSQIELGVANLDCSIIDLRPDDKLIVFSPVAREMLQKNYLWHSIKEWAGKDVEVILL